MWKMKMENKNVSWNHIQTKATAGGILANQIRESM